MGVARADRLTQSIETEVGKGVGAEKLTDLGDAVCGSDQLIAVRACRSRSSTGTRTAGS